MAEIEEKTTKKRRKGIRNDDLYKRNMIPKARVKGTEYTSYKNKAIPAKTLGVVNCR